MSGRFKKMTAIPDAVLLAWPLGSPCPRCKRWYTLIGLTDPTRKQDRVCSACGYDAHKAVGGSS